MSELKRIMVTKAGRLPSTSSRVMNSPVGALTLVGGQRGLAAILWENDDPRRVPIDIDDRASPHPVLLEAERQLLGYFAGECQSFDLPLDWIGTDFQKRVWAELLRIPYGETRSYGQIARNLGDPNLMRAVGAANGRNPISIVAPCHRVIGASGQLTGFAGGLAAKAFLLALEGAGQGDLFRAPVEAVPGCRRGRAMPSVESVGGRARRSARLL